MSSTRPLVVDIKTAAQMLSCSRQHVYDLIDRGTLRRVEIVGSSAVRVPVADIHAAVGLDSPMGGDAA